MRPSTVRAGLGPHPHHRRHRAPHVVAMTGAGLLVYTLESARIDARSTSRSTRRSPSSACSGASVDPETGAGFDRRGPAAEVFLERNVPDDDEMLVGYQGDRPRSRTTNRTARAPRRPALPGRGRLAAGRRRHGRGRRRRVRRGLGDRRARAQRHHGRGAGDRQLPRRRALRARQHPADLRARRAALARPDHAARRPAVRPAPGPAAVVRETAEDITETDLSRRIPRPATTTSPR